jgi:hypothetical protein
VSFSSSLLLMNVDRSNFEAVFEAHVCAAIASADFIAFDCEMSGIRRNDEPRTSSLDNLQDRYVTAGTLALMRLNATDSHPQSACCIDVSADAIWHLHCALRGGRVAL